MKKRSKKEELGIIASGDMLKIKKAIEDYAFTSETQIALLRPENSEILNLYLTLRKPCKDFVEKVLIGDYDENLVEASVVGNSLDADNEIILIERYPYLVKRYCEENPAGPYLHERAYEVAVENEELATFVQKRPIKAAAQNLGEMFSPEILKKLGYC